MEKQRYKRFKQKQNFYECILLSMKENVAISFVVGFMSLSCHKLKFTRKNMKYTVNHIVQTLGRLFKRSKLRYP